MSRARVAAVRSVDVAVTNLDVARTFFTEAWNLEVVAEEREAVYLRASGPFFHVLSLHTGPQTGLIRVVFGADNRKTTDEIYEQVRSAGQPTDGAPRPLNGPGGGYGFGFKDPEGRNFAVVCEVADHTDRGRLPDLPTKISHVNLNCRDNDATFNFFAMALGFKLSDQTRQFRFIRCNSDHHSVVLGFNNDIMLNHIAFEMPDLDSVMRGIGRMRDHGHGVEWGPGRHGPGNNAFAYFCGPEELPLEYTTEMEQVDDSHRMRAPEEWTWPAGRLDHWGITPGPSARVKRAQAFYGFLENGYRLGD